MYLGKDENGKNIYKSVTADTKKEAEYLAAEMQLKKKEKAKSDLVLSEAYKRYINSKKNVLSPSTVLEYIRLSNKSFQALMNKQIDEITLEMIQCEINSYALDHSAKSVRNAYGLFSTVMKTYRPDFAVNIRLPQKQKYARHIPSEYDVRRLIIASEGKRIQVPILLAAFGSLRRGEIAALRPADITDKGVNINKAVALNEKREQFIKQPKSYHEYRFVELQPWIIQRARSWNGFGMSINCITAEFSKIVEVAKIEHIRFHDLRHFYASERHALGVPDKYIMQTGGWAAMSVLQDVYQHTMQEKQDEFTKRTLDHFEKFNPDRKE